MQLLRSGISLRIHAIFISHVHGDHLFGLFGLLSTFGMMGRKDKLTIYAPAQLQDILNDHLKYFGEGMTFPLAVHAINTEAPEQIYENDDITVHTIPLKHRIPTSGFLFREKMPLRNLHSRLIAKYNLPPQAMVKLKNGENITLPNGDILENETVTYLPYYPRSYAYCSDTLFSEQVIEQVKNVDLLYHEATFLTDKMEVAHQTMHSTAAEAATVAREANVKHLLIGHFSSRYKCDELFLQEAQPVFPHTAIAKELATFEIPLIPLKPT